MEFRITLNPIIIILSKCIVIPKQIYSINCHCTSTNLATFPANFPSIIPQLSTISMDKCSLYGQFHMPNDLLQLSARLDSHKFVISGILRHWQPFIFIFPFTDRSRLDWSSLFSPRQNVQFLLIFFFFWFFIMTIGLVAARKVAIFQQNIYIYDPELIIK